MNDITFERIEDRPVNYVSVVIYTEAGCDPLKDEYTAIVASFVGSLDISSPGGVDDVSLVKEAIANSIEDFNLPEEGVTQVVLKESGEWEDVFWHKYYIVERVCIVQQ